MSDMTIIPPATIRPARGDDAPAVAGTLAAAFHDDPVFAWCLPDRARRRAVLPASSTWSPRQPCPTER